MSRRVVSPHEYVDDKDEPGTCAWCPLPEGNQIHDPERVAAHQAEQSRLATELAALQDAARRRYEAGGDE